MLKIKKFAYTAFNHNNIFQEGELNAENERDAYITLQHQGLITVELKEIEKNFSKQISEYLEKFKVGDKWTALFFRQLSMTLDVMNLNDALNLFLLSAKNKTQQKILQSIINDIKRGKSLADSMQNHSQIFSHNVIQMINIAQKSGRMQEISERLADRLEKNYKSRKKLQSALYYPAVVFIVSLFAAAVLINVMLPTFASFFESQGSSLPELTLFFMKSAIFVSENFLSIFSSIIFLFVGFIFAYKKILPVRIFFDKLFLKIPFIGKLICYREWMNAFGSLSFLIESGIQIDDAVGMIAAATSNKYLRSIWLDIKYNVAHGDNLQSEIFPTEYQGLIATGEASGTLSDMLRRCEKMSEFELEEFSNQIPVKAEIFGTLFVGLIVAGIVFSVVLPILSIGL